MADLLLTDEELCQLTDCDQPAAQIRWLERNGIPHLVSAKKRPRVARAWFEGLHRRGFGYAEEPNYDALG